MTDSTADEFRERPTCIKCGDDFSFKKYQGAYRIKCECGNCGYAWYMKSKDAE